MGIWRRRRTRAVLAVGVVLASVSLSVQPAAAASCYYGTCTGKDPNPTGCTAADAETEREFTTNRFRVELRYSFGCRAGWARATSRYVSLGSDTVIGIDAATVNPGGGLWFRGQSTIRLFPDAVGETDWTLMIGSYSSSVTYYGAFRAWLCNGEGSPSAHNTYENCRRYTPLDLAATPWIIPRNG